MTEQQQALYCDVFLDKYTSKLYIFNGNKWLEIVPTSVLKNKTNE